ncbi:MAG: hypothetical protein SOZ92_04640 [Porphyromonas somerae]|nr:hypothetical protein [Porphyromonas somerae]
MTGYKAPARVLRGCLVCGALSDRSDKSDRSDESLVSTLMLNLGIVERDRVGCR